MASPEDEAEQRPLPHPALMLEARTWLRAGCPTIPSREGFYVPERAISTLLRLVANLPAHHTKYAYGTPEWREAMDAPCPEMKTRKRRKKSGSKK